MKLYVPLRGDEYERLVELARTQRRPTREQAAVLIAAGLKSVTDSPVSARGENDASR